MPVKKKLMKMTGGAVGSVCPPGVWCLDTGFIVLAILVVGLIVALVYILNNPKKPAVVVVERKAPPEVIRVPVPTAVVGTAVGTVGSTGGGGSDPRFFPRTPEREYENTLPGIPINQMTRAPGYPDAFQQIGVLTAPGGSETSASPSRTILPLFGRKLVTNRDRWNYYTRTDGINPVQVPLNFKRRNCDDDNGCDEITSGDSVSVPILGQSYVANVYRYSTPRYIPF
jgi:hypothetical protein